MKKYLVITCVIVLIGFGIYLYIHSSKVLSTNSETNEYSTDDYIGFTNASYDSIPPGSTTIELIPTTPIGLDVTLISPDNVYGPMLEIKDRKVGVACDTDKFLITNVFVSKDEKTALVYNYSESNKYIDIIDTHTCTSVSRKQLN